jgi:hypothetical protein
MKYQEALALDPETISMITKNLGSLCALDTPEKRACFRCGVEAGFSAQWGTFSHSDQPNEKFHGWRALHPLQATENDAFYASIGSSLSLKIKKTTPAAEFGRLGGSVKSDKKSKSSAANGALGGRPRKTPPANI